ncbi:hypothetical protein B0T11DRAFT_284260 [Plectosphaerella cucumerina]|uniref:Uncharacterized protein n=1 Tax=Plectosphaerella cucumerina TaxID=40658 RepID=A0A8K0TB44_9PEZI|nr:hypothetical protein B0T11DRAFT_284260 [Plectosphaerella cucumerina]
MVARGSLYPTRGEGGRRAAGSAALSGGSCASPGEAVVLSSSRRPRCRRLERASSGSRLTWLLALCCEKTVWRRDEAGDGPQPGTRRTLDTRLYARPGSDRFRRFVLRPRLRSKKGRRRGRMGILLDISGKRRSGRSTPGLLDGCGGMRFEGRMLETRDPELGGGWREETFRGGRAQESW